MDKSTCRCRGAPSPPLTTAAAEKTVSGPGTETESRAVTERGSERGSGKEAGRERESVIGHKINQWTHTIRCSPHTHLVDDITQFICKSVDRKCRLTIHRRVIGAVTHLILIMFSFCWLGAQKQFSDGPPDLSCDAGGQC